MLLKFIPFIITFVLIFLNVPVAISMIAGSFLYFTFIDTSFGLTNVIQGLVSANMSNELLTIPYFIIVGVVMNYAGITKRLMHFCETLVGHRSGGLAQVNVLLSTLNGGICGSSIADAAMQCKILVPEMEKNGYSTEFSAAVTAASGLISPMIPPGNNMILYAVMTGCSVTQMFFCGYLPGLLMCVAEMLLVSIISHRRGYRPSRATRAGLVEVLTAFLHSAWAILIASVLIIGVRFGLFTITEGAVVIIWMGIAVGCLVYHEFSIRDLPRLFMDAFRETSSIMLMTVGALSFGMYLSWARIPQTIAAAIMTIVSSPTQFLILAMLLVLLFGMLLNGASLLLIFTPLLWPIAQAYGINVYVFGILMVLNASIGALTPPVGGVMYVCLKLTNTSMARFTREILPFIFVLALLLIFFMVFPESILWLPRLIG